MANRKEDEKNERIIRTLLKFPDNQRCINYMSLDPTMYLKYISALYDYYEKEFDRFDPSGHTALPLVVNTSGWVKGLGFDILVDMLKYISPTHMVQIRISAESKNLSTGGFWLDKRDDASATLIEISSARQDSLKRSVLVQKDARLLQDLHIIAYFRQCFSSDMNITTIKELARSLAAHLLTSL